ncbi:unnamed protein product [Chironomus riparius]|uniref:Alpha 1,4-glycosyltransferase domain-containing protein n=1 Tax=Chironomus riparius TaxID=315576 RepID=A0A9P0JAQ3_9DIPT|nr:unnamed protein product [Chironomus riparius]
MPFGILIISANLNPDYTIHLIFLTPTHQMMLRYTTLLKVLMSYKNIKIQFMNVKDYCKGTELDSWIKGDPFWKYSTGQIADVMKIMSVFKYGGVIMNFDTLSIRSLHEIDHPSFACSAHGRFAIYDGVVRLDTKFGSKLALGFFERLQKAFQMIPLSSGEEKDEFINKESEDPHDPHRLLSNTLQSSCPDVKFHSNTSVECDDILIFPTDKCAQKLGRSRSKMFMLNNKKFPQSEVSNSFFVNIETKGSNSGYLKIYKRSDYAKLARKFCPKVVKSSGKFI